MPSTYFSMEQLADLFTKSFFPEPFTVLASKLGMVDIYL